MHGGKETLKMLHEFTQFMAHKMVSFRPPSPKAMILKQFRSSEPIIQVYLTRILTIGKSPTLSWAYCRKTFEETLLEKQSRRPIRGGVVGDFGGLKEEILGLFEPGQFGVEPFQQG